MIVVGAHGHAKEIAGILHECGMDEVYFFDDVSEQVPDKLFGQFKILRTEKEVRAQFKINPRFALGLGRPANRKKMTEKFEFWGGQLSSVISPSADIGSFDVLLDEGLNIMTGAVLTQSISVGRGALINTHCSVHHDVRVGAYCELAPGCRILGHVILGSLVSVGSGAIILPRLKIGDGAVIGAGAVVTKDIPEGVTVMGVPATIRKA